MPNEYNQNLSSKKHKHVQRHAEARAKIRSANKTGGDRYVYNFILYASGPARRDMPTYTQYVQDTRDHVTYTRSCETLRR